MNDILHANIFFIITSVVVVVLAVFWAIILWYVIGIVREVRSIARRLSTASENIEKDFNDFRMQVRAGGDRVRSLGLTFFEFMVRRLTAGSARSKKRPPKVDATQDDLVQ
jgi:nitrogen fixation/metabolism regulation signal transduction histidine kinase